MEEQYINQGKAEAAAIVVREDEQEDAIDLIELFYFVWGTLYKSLYVLWWAVFWLLELPIS